MAGLISMYAGRSAQFRMLSDGSLIVMDPVRRPGIFTMDPWPSLVFKLADGEERTVAEIVALIAEGYETPPAGLSAVDRAYDRFNRYARRAGYRIDERPHRIGTRVCRTNPRFLISD